MGDGFGVLEKNFQQKESRLYFNFEPQSLEYKFGIDGRKPAEQLRRQINNANSKRPRRCSRQDSGCPLQDDSFTI
jgi:hypothetical protein